MLHIIQTPRDQIRDNGYEFIGYLPELQACILRNENERLELWAVVAEPDTETMTVGNREIKFVRDVDSAWRVVDCDYNRRLYPDDIGRIYLDNPPAYARVKEL